MRESGDLVAAIVFTVVLILAVAVVLAAVVRATRVFGRSADLPACVPQLGD